MRWALGIGLLLGCGSGSGGDDDGPDDPPCDPMSAVFLFNGDTRGDTVLQGQVAQVGAVGLTEGSGCSNPMPDDPISLATFLAPGSPELMEIGDVGLRGLQGLVTARPIDETNLTYQLVQEDIPYPPAGTEVSVFADCDGFEASLIIGEAPTVTAPIDGGAFMRTADLPMTVSAPGADGIVVDMDFTNDARALCFFPHDGDIVIPREAIAGELGPNPETTFLLTGSTNILVGSWTIGTGGRNGVDVNLISISTTALTLQLQ